jgi:hypothetical protein
MMEKAKKTSKYIKIHYNAINETKKSIKRTLEEISKEYDTIYILKSESEINQVLDAAVDEYLGKGMNFDIRIVDINQKTNINDKKSSVLLYLSEDEEEVKEYKNIDKLDIVNLLERI